LLHLSPDEFYGMRVGEFWEALKAYREEKDADRRHMGELIRGAALRLFNLQLKKGSQILDPAKFWPMPWDEERVGDDERIVQELDKLSDEQRTEKALELLTKVGFR
jgi:hypothetical protein